MLLLFAGQQFACASDIYGYLDDKGVAHFASEQLDERYQLFFRGGQSFDTADGLSLPGRGLGPSARKQARRGGGPSSASQALIAMFDDSPGYQSAKAALRDASNKHDIDYELLQALVAAESGFDARAVSPKGAIGLMQLMPATAERYGVQADRRATIEKKLFDPRINIAAGARYLRDLIAMFPGELELALAAYNAGEGAVQRAGNRIPNYRETQDYVQTVLQLYAYLKPGVTGATAARSGGRAPERVKMEIGGGDRDTAQRGNTSPPSGAATPELPATASIAPTSPFMPEVPPAAPVPALAD